MLLWILWCYCIFLGFLAIINFSFSGVGRGVLRFRGCRYRKTRSNFRGFIDFAALLGNLGVDIILYRLGLSGGLLADM